jgi:hypothetical protein
LPVDNTGAPLDDIILSEEDIGTPLDDIILSEEDIKTPLDDIILSEEDMGTPLDDIILSEEDIRTPLDDIILSEEDTETLGIPDAIGIFEDSTWIVDDPKGTVETILFVMDIGIVVDGGLLDLLRDDKPELATFILGAIELSCVIMFEVMGD